jgi:hypothetical protein
VEIEVFLVSIIYWLFVLTILIWLNRRLSSLEEKLANLEREGKNED